MPGAIAKILAMICEATSLHVLKVTVSVLICIK